MTRRNWRWILIALVLLIVVLGMGATFALRPLEPMPQALAALQSDSQIRVTTAQWLIFTPRATEVTTGFVFYPGGLVDPRAYAPMAKEIAAHGYLVVIVPMPLNLAFFDANRAQEVIQAYPAINRWAIGGHSLGGVAAAMFVKNNPNATRAIAFWASYPADNLADSRVIVASIYGTKDSAVERIDASRNLMPASTKWIAIEGGNHAQFGYYGNQSGDRMATISREEQQKQIVGATIELLKQVEN